MEWLQRIIDYIPLAIDHHYLYKFANDVHAQLFERLMLGAPDAARRCATYIAEDPSVVVARDELISKKKRLESVQKALISFGMGPSM